jgi:flagellar biosynthesis/type III secretory pathway protein FliH
MSFLMWHRGGDARVASSRLVLRPAEVPLLQDAHVLRDRLVDLVQRESERVVRAEQESAAALEAALAAAREEGLAQGRAEGHHEAREKLAAHLVSLAQASALERERLQASIGALALQVARKMLGKLPDDTLLAALADTAARETLTAPPIALVVHPDRVDAVRAQLAAHARDDDSALRCEVRGEATCPPDTCRLETEHGTIDASLEAQLTRLADAWGIAAEGADR